VSFQQKYKSKGNYGTKASRYKNEPLKQISSIEKALLKKIASPEYFI
jgi:hypothetical protein